MKPSGNRLSLFLVELILDLALFAVCAAVCVGLLIHARGMSRESTRLTDAVYIAQTAADTLRSGSTLTAGAWSTRGPEENGAYFLSVERSDEGNVHSARISVSADNTPLYSLGVSWPEGGAAP